MRIIIYLTLIIFVACVFISACAWTSGVNNEIIFPEKNVSFMLHVKPFLSMNCSFSPCHGVNFGGGMALIEWHNIIQVPGFITAGDPDNSRFVWVLEKKSFHRDFYRANIKDNHIKGVRQWILEGGINN